MSTLATRMSGTILGSVACCLLLLAGCDGEDHINAPGGTDTAIQFSEGPLGPEFALPFSAEYTATGDAGYLYGANSSQVFLLDLTENALTVHHFLGAEITALYQYTGTLYAGLEYDLGNNFLGEYLIKKESATPTPVFTQSPEHVAYTLARFSAPDNFRAFTFFEEAMPDKVLSVIDDGGRSPITFEGDTPKVALGTDWSGYNPYTPPNTELLNGQLTYVRGPYQLFVTTEDRPKSILHFNLSFYNFTDPTILEFDRPVGSRLLGGENSQFVLTQSGEFVYPASLRGQALWPAPLTAQSAAFIDNSTVIVLTSDTRLQKYDLKAPGNSQLISESAPLAIESGELFSDSGVTYLIANGEKLIKLNTDEILKEPPQSALIEN